MGIILVQAQINDGGIVMQVLKKETLSIYQLLVLDATVPANFG
jgi:hypothetical protein